VAEKRRGDSEAALERASENMRKQFAKHASEFENLTIKELRTQASVQNVRNQANASIVTIVILLLL
jgi:hypothetical protein